MDDTNWRDVTEEVIEKDGKEISKRITRQAKETPSRTTPFKDWVEVILKIGGLLTVIVAMLKYFDSVEQRHLDEVHQRVSDSTSNDHWKQQELDQQKKIADDELNAKRTSDQQHEETEKRLANNLEIIAAQKKVDIDKEKREFFLSNLTTASAQMEILVDKPVSSPEYAKAKDLLFIEVYPRLGAIGDTAILNRFLSFKDYAISNEAIGIAYIDRDSVEQFTLQISILDLALSKDSGDDAAYIST